jgi:hypothetical protein
MANAVDSDRPDLDGRSRKEKARILHRESLESLDLALDAVGSERMLLLNTALKLRRWAKELERDAEG